MKKILDLLITVAISSGMIALAIMYAYTVMPHAVPIEMFLAWPGTWVIFAYITLVIYLNVRKWS